MKAVKILSVGTLILLLLVASLYFYFVYKNNLDIKEPTSVEIETALDGSINWILDNQDELLNVNNPALWWFLYESANLTNNRELAQLVSKYRNTTLDKNTVWAGYFKRTPPILYVTGMLNHIEKYQKFFIYGLTCDSDLGDEADIHEQLDINFCNWKPYYSSCSTHQLMGIRLLQTKNCNNQKLYRQLSKQLINVIEEQIVWDPRVGDVYMQRVLMLLESGHAEKVKPTWIRQILQEQRSNGAWANFYRLINITDTIEFGFGYKFPEIRSQPKASFHTTAQAIYVLSLINAEYK